MVLGQSLASYPGTTPTPPTRAIDVEFSRRCVDQGRKVVDSGDLDTGCGHGASRLACWRRLLALQPLAIVCRVPDRSERCCTAHYVVSASSCQVRCVALRCVGLSLGIEHHLETYHREIDRDRDGYLGLVLMMVLVFLEGMDL